MSLYEKTVEIDLDTARLIRQAFVPRNPRKLRNCDPDVRQAALRFIELVEHAERTAPLPSSGTSK